MDTERSDARGCSDPAEFRLKKKVVDPYLFINGQSCFFFYNIYITAVLHYTVTIPAHKYVRLKNKTDRPWFGPKLVFN